MLSLLMFLALLSLSLLLLTVSKISPAEATAIIGTGRWDRLLLAKVLFVRWRHMNSNDDVNDDGRIMRMLDIRGLA